MRRAGSGKWTEMNRTVVADIFLSWHPIPWILTESERILVLNMQDLRLWLTLGDYALLRLKLRNLASQQAKSSRNQPL